MIPKLKSYWQSFIDMNLKFSMLISYLSILPLLIATSYHLLYQSYNIALLLSATTYILTKINKEMRA